MVNREKINILRSTVQSYIHEMGIAGIAPRPKTSKVAPENKIYGYLLRLMNTRAPQSYLGNWYHLYSSERKLGVSGHYYRLVLTFCCFLEVGSNTGTTFCPCRGSCYSKRLTHHMEQ
jgi:hypothetical protein